MNTTPCEIRHILRAGIVSLAAFALAVPAARAQDEQPEPSSATSGAAAEGKPASDSDASAEDENGSGEQAQEKSQESQTLLVYDRHLRLTIPARWKVVKPRNRIIEVEVSVPPREKAGESETDDEAAPAGRLTMMAAGGDVDANIRRWVGQFRLGRDGDGKDAMRRERRRLRGAVAHVLDIAGTYFDSPRGPLGPKVELPDYRMLGAIIEVQGAGKYFVKFYGPASIIEENEEEFAEMLASLEVVSPEAEAPSAENVEAAEATEVRG